VCVCGRRGQGAVEQATASSAEGGHAESMLCCICTCPPGQAVCYTAPCS
jgi:hypothetical protein